MKGKSPFDSIESVIADIRRGRMVIVVDDEAIISAMRLVWERMKIVVEPSAACAVAAADTELWALLQQAARDDRCGG